MDNIFYKAIIFDMGEVLVQTVDRSPRTTLAKQFHLSYEELESLVYFSNSALQAMAGKITEEDHFNFVLRELGNTKLTINEFQKAFWGGDNIDEKMISFISTLKNKYRLGLLSNAMDTTRQRLTGRYKLMDYFDVSIFSYEVNLVKPDPEIYKLIIGQLDVRPKEAIFIDDMIENVNAAKDLGLTTIQFKNSTQTIEIIQKLLSKK